MEEIEEAVDSPQIKDKVKVVMSPNNQFDHIKMEGGHSSRGEYADSEIRLDDHDYINSDSGRGHESKRSRTSEMIRIEEKHQQETPPYASMKIEPKHQ